MFYFRDGANHASVYTKSKIVSENIKWNLNIKSKKIKSIIVNTRSANAFTGPDGYKGLKEIAQELSIQLSKKQIEDEDQPKKILTNEILFGCTGTIGEKYPTEKIKKSIPELIKKIKYTQNKPIWMKAALGIMTTDLKPKLAMEECEIGNKKVKIYGVAKGSGMIFPNMATTLGYVFTDANLSNDILNKLLKKNIETTFNAITCDGDTSTNDMVSIFSTGKVNNPEIKNITDQRIKSFDEALHTVLLNLAKRVVADGEGASKFITINVVKSKSEHDAKKIAFSIANSPLVKTAIAGCDPNWGRIIMALGKTSVDIEVNKLSIKLGSLKIIEKGMISKTYIESDAQVYMKEEKKIDITIDLNLGRKNFTVYTMDLTKKYIDINTDYRS
jgi:glutamate N-acetyltransferase/amino-acid N-acetyltransferase